MKRVLIISLSPAIQRTLEFKSVELSKVNRAKKHFISISGKGINIARALKSTDINASCLTHIGTRSKKFFKSESRKENLHIIPVYTRGEIRTCTTLLEQEGRTTEIVEESQKVSGTTGYRVSRRFKNAINNFHIIVISGSVAPGYSDKLIPQLVKYAKDKGKVVILDITGETLLESIKYYPDYIKINSDEFHSTFRGNYQEEAVKLIKKGIRLIVTGGEGCISYLKNSIEMKYSPKLNSSPLNTTGCGDAFTAGLISSIIDNKSIEDAVKRASDFGYRNTLTYIPGSIK